MNVEDYHRLRAPLLEYLQHEREAYERRTMLIRAELVKLQEMFYMLPPILMQTNERTAADILAWMDMPGNLTSLGLTQAELACAAPLESTLTPCKKTPGCWLEAGHDGHCD